MLQIDKQQLQNVQNIAHLFTNLEACLDLPANKNLPESVVNAIRTCNTEINQFVYVVTEKHKDFVTNFYSGELEAFLKVEGEEGINKQTKYTATIRRSIDNGEYDLTICTTGEDSELVESFSNYLDEDEAKEDLDELQRLGYDIEED